MLTKCTFFYISLCGWEHDHVREDMPTSTKIINNTVHLIGHVAWCVKFQQRNKSLYWMINTFIRWSNSQSIQDYLMKLHEHVEINADEKELGYL